MSNKLVILDINGLLCCKELHIDKSPNKRSMKKTTDCIDLRKMRIYIRPGAVDFINNLMKNYRVGFWSSTTEWNAKQIIQALDLNAKKFAFTWYRDRTKLDPDYLKNTKVKKHDTVKNMQDIFDCPTINESRRYGWRNTVLIDDSKSKTRFNPVINLINVSEYELKDVGRDETYDLEFFELLQDRIERKFDIMREL